MKNTNVTGTTEQPTTTPAGHEAMGAVAGAAAGAALGAIAGPPGAIVGGVVGGIAGAIATVALERGAQDEENRAERLDAQIGVSDGELGAPNLRHPPARTGAYSAASAGVESTTGGTDAEGPLQAPGDG